MTLSLCWQVVGRLASTASRHACSSDARAPSSRVGERDKREVYALEGGRQDGPLVALPAEARTGSWGVRAPKAGWPGRCPSSAGLHAARMRRPCPQAATWRHRQAPAASPGCAAPHGGSVNAQSLQRCAWWWGSKGHESCGTAPGGSRLAGLRQHLPARVLTGTHWPAWWMSTGTPGRR